MIILSFYASSFYAFYSICWSSPTVSYLFIFALLLTFFALTPNLKVETVSCKFVGCGEQVITRVVLELPPRDSCRILVSLD